MANGAGRFTTIDGGKGRGYHCGTTTLYPVTASIAPATGTVIVEEQDRYLLLSTTAPVTPSTEHPIHLYTDLVDQRPLDPATILFRRDRYRVVVYDIDAEPLATPEGVAASYRALLHDAERRGIERLRLPPLAIRYRSLSLEQSIGLLVGALQSTAPVSAAIELEVDGGGLAPLHALLASNCPAGD